MIEHLFGYINKTKNRSQKNCEILPSAAKGLAQITHSSCIVLICCAINHKPLSGWLTMMNVNDVHVPQRLKTADLMKLKHLNISRPVEYLVMRLFIISDPLCRFFFLTVESL